MSGRRWTFAGEEIAPGRVPVRRLGSGGEYEVWLVWDDRLCAAAAAKLVRPDRLDDPAHVRRLGREAKLLDRLAHPCLPRCFDVALEASAPHILVEHLEGDSLRGTLRAHGPLDLDQLLPVAGQIAGVLHYFAVTGHVHLDVKPANIVLGAVPKLIDLSLARTLEAAARIDGVIGTPGYLSPEQCLAEDGAPVGSPADVWGLGVTLFEALEGERPFRRVTWKEVPSRDYPQVREAPARLRRAVPRRVADLVLDCLAKHPGARPTPAEVVVALEAW